MGFAVIGYPTKRQYHLSIENQLPLNLRTKNDIEYDKQREKSVRERTKKIVRKLKKRKLLDERLKALDRLKSGNGQRLLLTGNNELDRQLIEDAWVHANINTKYYMVKTRSNWLKQTNVVMRSQGSNKLISNQKEIVPYYNRVIKFKKWQPSGSKKDNIDDYDDDDDDDDKNKNKLDKFISIDDLSENIYSKDKTLKVSKQLNKRNLNSIDNKISKVSERVKKEKRLKEFRDKLSFGNTYDTVFRHIDNDSKLKESDLTSPHNSLNIQNDLEKSIDLEGPAQNTIPFLNNFKNKQTYMRNAKVPTKLSLDKLPPEVIQKIFVFSSANYNMLLTNKYLNYCLKLSDHLLEFNFIENYIYVVDKNTEEHIIDNGDKLSKIKYLNTKIFADPIMTKFFLRRLKYLKKKFDKFITDDIIKSGITTYKKPYLPHVLYVNIIDHYFKNVHILKYFLKKFEIVVSSLIDHIIDWFFHDQTKYKIQDLLNVMKAIKKYCKKYDHLRDKNIFTAHHLVSILEMLFLNNSGKPFDTIEFFQGLSSIGKEEEEKNSDNLPLEKLKINFVDIYVSTFYKPLSVNSENNDTDINMVLNDSSLWSCIRKISNIELIDVFVSHGVRPSYGQII